MGKNKFSSVFVLSALVLGLLAMVLSNAAAPVSAQGENTHEIVFTIPVGKEGVQYEGENVSEMLTWGPKAFTVAPDGSFWIADTVGNRLLHYSPKGDLLDMIYLDGQVVGAGDLEVTASDILVLSQAAMPAKVVRLALDGTVLASYELPKGLRLEDGLSGIALGDQGEVLVEREGGAYVSQLVDARGKMAPAPLDGYVHAGQLYTARPADMTAEDTTRGYITAGDRRIEVAVTNSLGGLRLLGVNPDGSFYVIAEEVVVSGTIQVDQTVRHYDAAGELLGLARVPLAEQYTDVEQGLVVGPDGAVYALITRPDRVEVQRLRFSKELKSILPAAPVEMSVQSEGRVIAPLACRSRDDMINTASGYVTNMKYLSATNTDGTCAGRGKPRYIGGAGTYSSVAYDWNGWDTVSGYNGYMYPNTYQAGDINTAGWESCSRGTDCSGLVSRAWDLSSKKDTYGLNNVSWKLSSTSDLLRGDIMNRAGTHVVLFLSFGPNGIYDYESTTDWSYDRVVCVYRSWGLLSGYEPRRYNDVC
jgi:hypothetical protein